MEQEKKREPEFQVAVDKCDHSEMWLVYIPWSKAVCKKCGWSRPLTDKEWDDF
jgi:hypothetical protein